MAALLKSCLKQSLLTCGRTEVDYGRTCLRTQGRGKHQIKEITLPLYRSKTIVVYLEVMLNLDRNKFLNGFY